MGEAKIRMAGAAKQMPGDLAAQSQWQALCVARQISLVKFKKPATHHAALFIGSSRMAYRRFGPLAQWHQGDWFVTPLEDQIAFDEGRACAEVNWDLRCRVAIQINIKAANGAVVAHLIACSGVAGDKGQSTVKAE